MGGEPRDTQEVYDAIQALSTPTPIGPPPTSTSASTPTMAENAVKADTLEELAGRSGPAARGVLAQVERYNSYCETASDDEFHKDKRFLLPVKQPPFYGIKTSLTRYASQEASTPTSRCTCDSQNDPILACTAWAPSWETCTATYDYKVPGINLGGACTTFGYLLGKNLSAGKW
ncbi:MAG: hypothetical protein ACLSVD_04300 [Eggerthellaceae bacterium]